MDGTTTQYFNLERGARQGDPIPAYILTIEILFLLIKLEHIPKLKVEIFSILYFFQN